MTTKPSIKSRDGSNTEVRVVCRRLLYWTKLHLFLFLQPFSQLSYIISIIHSIFYSPVAMRRLFYPRYSFSYIFYGHFFLIISLNTCEFIKWICFTLFSPLAISQTCTTLIPFLALIRDENYTTYYPPRDLAGYIPAYLVLLVVSALFIYMGLNMLSCPSVDSIDNIWDTQSIPSCSSTSLFATKDVYKDQRGVNDYSVPIICDEDVRLVNLRLRQLHMSWYGLFVCENKPGKWKHARKWNSLAKSQCWQIDLENNELSLE